MFEAVQDLITHIWYHSTINDEDDLKQIFEDITLELQRYYIKGSITYNQRIELGLHNSDLYHRRLKGIKMRKGEPYNEAMSRP